jgi:hypothetical protein
MPDYPFFEKIKESKEIKIFRCGFLLPLVPVHVRQEPSVLLPVTFKIRVPASLQIRLFPFKMLRGIIR